MKTGYLITITLICTFGAANQLLADEGQTSLSNVDGYQCTKIKDDKKRLACFDRLFTKEKSNNGQRVPLPVEKSAVNEFGARYLKDKNEDKVEEIRLVIEKVELNARKRQVFYFTNGQVWENKKSTKIRIKPGDFAIISEGAFSAYYLSKENITGKVRVKRIK